MLAKEDSVIDCRFKPIDQWPHQQTPSWKRKKSPFKAGWSQTLDLLEKELNHLQAKDIIEARIVKPLTP